MNLARLRDMDMSEIAVRGRQQASKLIERVTGQRAEADREGALKISLDAFRAFAPRRFFEGAVDDRSLDLLKERMPEACERVQTTAEAVCQGHIDLLGYQGLSFGDPLNWHLDPVSGRRAPSLHWSRIRPLDPGQLGDSKVIWELGRHQWLVVLAQAYRLTGDPRYATVINCSLRDFLRANPPGVGIHWASSLELALRIISWCWVLVLLRGSTALSAQLFGDLVAGIAAHARHVERYLSHCFSPNTHLTGEALGLFYAGVLFSELPLGKRWRERGARILIEQSTRQVLPDGVYFEQSTCYQRYTVETYLHFLILAARNAIPVPGEVSKCVERMLDFLLAVRGPDGGVPQIGDEDGGWLLPFVPREIGDMRGVFGTAAALFARADCAWAAGGLVPEVLWLLGPAGLRTLADITLETPRASSRVFAEGGYAIMSSGWRADAHHFLFDVGPLGYPVSSGHGHADLLSIQCSAFGEAFLVDPGTYVYTPEREWRDYFRSSLAHSTVTLDSVGQAEPRGPFAWESRPRAVLHRWVSTAEYDLADAEHDAYRRLRAPVVHRRRVVFVKPRYWVVADDLEGTEEHRVELRFQFAPIPVEVLNAQWVRARGKRGHAFLLRTFGGAPMQITVHEGETNPPRGWVSPVYGSKLAAPMAVCSALVSLPARFLTLLFPVPEATTGLPEVIALAESSRGPAGLVVGGDTILFREDGVVVKREG